MSSKSRPSGAGRDARPVPAHQRIAGKRSCLLCRQPFKPAHHYLFLCSACKTTALVRSST